MRRPVLVAPYALLVAACGGGPSDSSAAEWEALAPATLARTEVAAARVGRFVYVMGGFERAGGATTATTERYDIRRDRWTRVADMPVGSTTPRRRATAAACTCSAGTAAGAP
jgi:Kelch motif